MNTLWQVGHWRSSSGNLNPPITSATGWLGEEQEGGGVPSGVDEEEGRWFCSFLVWDSLWRVLSCSEDCSSVFSGARGVGSKNGGAWPLPRPFCRQVMSSFCSGCTRMPERWGKWPLAVFVDTALNPVFGVYGKIYILIVCTASKHKIPFLGLPVACFYHRPLYQPSTQIRIGFKSMHECTYIQREMKHLSLIDQHFLL